jgi:hypothetical protein
MPMFMYDNPEVKPLIKDFFSLPDIFKFLKSSNFDRVVVECKYGRLWEGQKNLKSIEVEQNSDEVERHSFNRLMHDSSHKEKDKTVFFKFIIKILDAYAKYFLIAPFEDIAADLKAMGADKSIMDQINTIQSSIYQVSPITINQDIQDNKRLNQAILDIRKALENGDYNDSITQANYLLEGLFKSYILHKVKIPIDKIPNGLMDKAAIVKANLLKNEPKTEFHPAYESLTVFIHNLTPLRNKCSTVHFDNKSDKWVAEYFVDIVQSIGRMLVFHMNK